MSVNQEKINAIKNKIWSLTQDNKPMSGNDIPDRLDDVYKAGQSSVWDNITDRYTRNVWDRGFSRWRVDGEFFRPQQTLDVTGISSQMFYYAVTSEPIDAQAIEEEIGHPLFDFRTAQRLDYFNNPGVFSTLGTIDLTGCIFSTSLDQFCATNTTVNYLTSIKKLIVHAETYFKNTMFRYCSNLTHCIFEGTIGTSGLTLSFCTSLDLESITSIFRCLSSETTGLSITLSQNAVNKAFETSEGADDGSQSQDWADYVGSRSNWTISLA